jgi:hypothetical protein
VAAIQRELGPFRAWCLCGGQSLDWLVGRETRPHGDTDIGVFRSDLLDCLRAIGQPRVYLCDPPGSLQQWDGGAVADRVHDVWITDSAGLRWSLQVMVYDDDDGQRVTYRRDPRIAWGRAAHTLTVRGVRVLNPAITMLFKINRQGMADKDCADVRLLITELAHLWSINCDRAHRPSAEGP